MIFILETLIFSLSVLWRFLIIVPVFAVVSLAIMVGLGFVFLPLAGILFPILATLAGLIAVRCGLAALGYGSSPVPGRLVGASLKFTFFQILVYLVMMLIAGLLIAVLNLYGVPGIADILQDFEVSSWQYVLAENKRLAAILVGLVMFILAFHTCLLVPVAAAASGAGEGARQYDFFFGFGSSFVVLFIITTVATGISYTVGDSPKTDLMYTKLTFFVFSFFTDIRTPQISEAEWLQMGAYALFAIWLFCWQYGAATLAFVRYRLAVEEEFRSEHAVEKADPEELRDLRKSRNQ